MHKQAKMKKHIVCQYLLLKSTIKLDVPICNNAKKFKKFQDEKKVYTFCVHPVMF